MTAWEEKGELFRAHFGDTPLSVDEQIGLIPSLATQRELNEVEFANIVKGRAWALSPVRLRRADVITVSYLLELHRRMFNATWRWAGKVRTTEKTIGVPPHQIYSDLGGLIGDVTYWIENASFTTDEIAIRFHHRLVVIHPFSNGNGRHARLAADVLALKLGRPMFPWGIGTQGAMGTRQAYLEALRLADRGDPAPLLGFARSCGAKIPGTDD